MSLSLNNSNQHVVYAETQDELNPKTLAKSDSQQVYTTNSTPETASNEVRNAMWYYLRAALRGDKDAQYQMGMSYLKGELSLDRSYVLAERWLNQASYQGHEAAKIELEKALTEISIS